MTKSYKAALIAVFLCLMTACSFVETVGDFVSENELLTSLATRQAVGRYIAAGDTLEEEAARAERVIERLERVDLFLDGNPKATADQIVDVIEASIDWEYLETSDKLLVMDILALLKIELERRYNKHELKENTVIAIRSLFETAISAARVYLLRS